MIRAAPAPQRYIIGTFLFLGAVACAVAPIPLALRSTGILLFSYLAFAVAGPPAGFAGALIAPAVGLVSGDYDWLVMLPIITSSNLLALIGLELTWRYLALLVSPLLQVIPQVFVLTLSKQELFEVTLPWEPNASGWIALHGLVAVAGVLLAIVLDRRRERQTKQA